MGTTKIIVLHLRQIIKSIIFFLIGTALFILLIISFIAKNNIRKPKENNKLKSFDSSYVPGEYISQIIIHNKPVKIQVSVDQNKILDIKLSDINKSQEVFYPLFRPALEKLSHDIIQYQSLDIPIRKEFVFTEKILLSAVNNALEKAKLY